ncbi:family 1 extracellular solute-binding protein [Paenibacillus terrae HPL-003]|uniref:Family 1 extracellular solute-binding protein n=1 Tax=Paenibacillus terrae (strain HPL-003) TaxID=985665 RepID=G7VPR7_PAETH|nr:ABC transporter substrate-binding protein [Paenibacillus terrae]AET61065.1 family 1 extracellular solute-binding protein [Paenibacillus terrae HPL-003]
MKNRRIILMVIVSILSIVVGCSNLSPEAGDVVEIQFAHGFSGDVIDQLVDEYNKSQDKVRVQATFIPGNHEGVVQKLQTLTVAKQLPDVIGMGYGYHQFALDNFPVVPLQSFIEQENYNLNDFFPNLLDLGRGPDGQVYSLPMQVTEPIMYINNNLLRASNLDPKNPPKTWDELREAAKKMTHDDQYGVYFEYAASGNWMFQTMLGTAHGNMMKDSKQVGFNSVEGRKALQYWVDLVNTDKSMPLLTTTQAEQSFLAGKVGIYIASSSRIAKYSAQKSIELSTAVFPSLDGNYRQVPIGGAGVMMLAKDNKKQQAAWDFIKFLASPESMTIYAKGTGSMVSRESALEKPEWMQTFLMDNPLSKTPYEQVKDAVPWNSFPGTDPVKLNTVLQDNITAAINQQKTVEDALRDAEAQANELLK